MTKRQIVVRTAVVVLMTGALAAAGDRFQASQESVDQVVSAQARDRRCLGACRHHPRLPDPGRTLQFCLDGQLHPRRKLRRGERQ
jgi:hypothetical protein